MNTKHPTEWILKSRRVLLPSSSEGAALRPASLRIGSDGRILAVEPDDFSSADRAVGVRDFGDLVVMPGIVDTHAHINEPGRTDWEGFRTATHAAAAGGITTVVDMPLNSIPATTSLEALEVKRRSAEGQCWIDHGFWGGVIPGNLAELAPMVRAGALGFKCFLIESGVEEFPHVSESELRPAMTALAALGVPLLVHAELDCGVSEDEAVPGAGTGTGTGAAAGAAASEARSYAHYLHSRPSRWEVEAIQLVIRLARETGCRTHIVHLSAADALEDLRRARSEGVPITAETCPHYLTFVSEEIPDGATPYKCAPPIRERENRERLWTALRNGEIEFVVSDHSPCTPRLKLLEQGDFGKAWGGIAGLQFSLPVVWSEMRRRGFGLSELTEWMSARTARFAGLAGRKGRIEAGFDADLVVWDPERPFRLESAMIHHKHRVTPYEGRELFGVVRSTILRGEVIYDEGQFSNRASGRALVRGSRNGNSVGNEGEIG